MTYRISKDVLNLNPGIETELGNTITPSKYHNARTEAKGMMFQSGREAAGVAGLILLEEQKQIFGLRLQVRFPLPGHTTYVADAVYAEVKDSKLQVVVKDFKGYATKEFKLKKRLFRETYGMEVEEA